MARNFTGQKAKRESSWRRQALPVALFVMIAALFLWGMGNVDASSGDERLAVVERAVTKAVVQCYALEGQYPASVSYLRENYGLIVDEERYIVRIDFLAGNIMPQITVLDLYF